ncbi:MAG: family 43 glycosylhydrolase [Bacteroidales bacterium]|nr:family 43 glycosylhydrolase [Bacteroidales bacterium]MBN2818153.1 family 43 glycosylhydrolase [Bacteroidales bacterium]
MKHTEILALLVYFLVSCQPKSEVTNTDIKTFCNPLNISYRFCLDEPSRREAADPTVFLFQDKYFLFASKSGGYWYSHDLMEWNFIQTEQIPVEEYAPTVIALGDTLFFLASSNDLSTIYKSANPLSGKWQVAVPELEMPVWDPAFFLDDDNKLYLYWGCSNQNPIYGVEVDYNNNFSFMTKPVELKHQNPEECGWEVPGDYNTLVNQKPWIEGAWMNKQNGKYYLQYAGPGTEFKSYSDGVYVSENPLGPFNIQQHNPFAYKPEGFAAGAGHGSTFKDKNGNWWHIGTITISQKHMFERRLGLYPLFFDAEGNMHAETKFGDYPIIMPQQKINNFKNIFPGWMLLSYQKKIEVSSSIDALPACNITDENIRTYWAAASGDSGEFAILDLEKPVDVYALQVNFAEHNTNLFDRQEELKHRYTVEYSDNKADWKMLVDKSSHNLDNTHDYTQLDEMITCRYLKLTNIEVPDGNFALSGFRVFGNGKGELPGKIKTLEAKRNGEDGRSVQLNWSKSENATGYNICYGTDQDKLYLNYTVYGDTSLTINSLNSGLGYYFTIEAFNENGVTEKEVLVEIK